MKTYKRLYDKCLDKEYIKAEILVAAKGKRKRKDVVRTLANIDRYVDKIYEILLTESYKPHLPRETVISEGTRPKKRIIRKIRFFDQIIHHIVIDACKDVFMQGMYVYCCGSVPGRGIHYGKKYIERWVQTDFKNTKYCAQMDIRHYFESVDHEVLKRRLRKRIADKRMLWLLDTIIDSGGEGIPLGFYTSQWFANYLLEDLDHYIKEQLHVKYYVRYLDDMVIFGRNKKELHRARAAIAEHLEKELNLQMKGNWQLFRMVYTDRNGKERGRALDFLGFRFYREKTILRKSLMLRITRTAGRISRKKKPTVYDAASMLSYMGWITNSDSYLMYESRIKPQIEVKQLKEIVSRHSRKGEKIKNAEIKNHCSMNYGDARTNYHCWGGFWQPAEGVGEDAHRQCYNCKFYIAGEK